MKPEITIETGGAVNIVEIGQEFYFNRKRCKVLKLNFTSFEYKFMDQPNPNGKQVMTYDFYIYELGKKVLNYL